MDQPRPTKRSDAAYEIEALSKGLAVLEALEGTNFEPVKQSRIEQRTGFSRDLCMRTLRTLRLRGYAFQNERGEWMVGPRFIRMARVAAEAFPLSEKQRKEIEELMGSGAPEPKTLFPTVTY